MKDSSAAILWLRDLAACSTLLFLMDQKLTPALTAIVRKTVTTDRITIFVRIDNVDKFMVILFATPDEMCAPDLIIIFLSVNLL